MWPGVDRIAHWSVKNMEQRCQSLGDDFDELYQNHYGQMSWYVNSGVTGIAHMTGDSLTLLCGIAFCIIMQCYAIILEELFNVFKIYNADDKLWSLAS